MPNSHLKTLADYFNEGFRDGRRMGQQQVIDATLVLMARMGKLQEDGVAYFKDVSEVLDEYESAFHKSDDQPIWQERMDEELKMILGEEIDDFHKRYPDVAELGYDKAVREKRHPATKKRRKR